jgi:hypothetical protein
MASPIEWPTPAPGEIVAAMIQYGWDTLWYANPFPDGAAPTPEDHRKYGPRWHAGVWTGPGRDLLCVRRCATFVEADRWLSPAGWTPLEAIQRAAKLAAGALH